LRISETVLFLNAGCACYFLAGDRSRFDRIYSKPKAKLMTRILVPASLFVAMSAFLASAVLPSTALAQNAPPSVTAAKPIVREVIDNDEFIGRFQAVDEVSVRSRVGGYLQEIHFKD